MKCRWSATIKIQSRAPTPRGSEKDKKLHGKDKHANARDAYRPDFSFPRNVITMLNSTENLRTRSKVRLNMKRLVVKKRKRHTK